MSVIYTSNQLEMRAQDGIFINLIEVSPAPRIIGTNITKVVGEFPWGPFNTPTLITDPEVLSDTFFGGVAVPENWGGGAALIGKAWGPLYIVRGKAAAAAKATRTIAGSTPENIFRVSAKYEGDAGNEIKVLYEKVTNDLFNVKVTFGGKYEEFLNLPRTTAAFAGLSPKWVDLAWLDADASEALPNSDSAPVALSGGDDGTVSDAELTGGPSSVVGLRTLETVEDGGFAFFAERASADLTAALRAHNVIKNMDSVAQGHGADFAANLVIATAIEDATLRLTLHKYKQRYVSGVKEVMLNALVASVISQIPPNRSIADYDNKDLLGIVAGFPAGLALGSAEYKAAQVAGGITLEPIRRAGQAPGASGTYKIKAGLTTDPDQPSDMSARLRRLVGVNIGEAALPYQNKPGVTFYTDGCLLAVTSLLDLLKGDESQPTTQFIEDFSARLVSRTGAEVVYELKVKLIGEMRYIIFNLTVGENVTITATN